MIQTWMDSREKQLILDCLTDNMTMLEWGSGGSTLEFSSIVDKYYSIEHNKDWYDKISTELKKYPLNDVTYKYVKQNSENTLGKQSEYHMYKDYIDIVDKFNVKFDVVLIDGRARRLCAKKIIPYLNPDSIVFIHDYVLRTAYWVVEDYYELIDCIYDTQQTIGKFKLKTIPIENAYDLTLKGTDRLMIQSDEISRNIKSKIKYENINNTTK